MKSDIDIAFWHETPKLSRASFRLRCFNVVSALKNRGLNVELFEKSMIPKVLILSRRYDTQTLEYAAMLKQKYGTKIGLDLCDNHFYYEKNSAKFEERKRRLMAACESVDFVISSSNELKKEILKHCSPKEIEVIGDTVETPYFEKNIFSANFWSGFFWYLLAKNWLKSKSANGRLIWFGNHGTLYASGGMEDVGMILKTLEEISKNQNISLTIVSNSRKKYSEIFSNCNIKSLYIPWNRYFISKILQMHSVSLIPVRLTPFTACKTNNRVATSILHGLAVCCSPIPSYEEIIECVSGEDEWFLAINRYLDESKRQEQVQKVASKLEAGYTDSAIFSRWHSLLCSKLIPKSNQ